MFFKAWIWGLYATVLHPTPIKAREGRLDRGKISNSPNRRIKDIFLMCQGSKEKKMNELGRAYKTIWSHIKILKAWTEPMEFEQFSKDVFKVRLV